MNHLRAPAVRYGFAAVMVTLATAVSLQDEAWISPLLPPQLYVLSVLLSGTIAGLSAGVFAFFLSLAAGGYWISSSYENIGRAILPGVLFVILSLSILYILMINRSLRERADCALKALTKRELELRTTIEALPVGIWFTDKDGRIISGNKAARNIWGGIRYIGPEEHGTYKIFNAATKTPLSREKYPITRALAGEHVQDHEVEIRTFDNKHRKLLISAVPLRTPDDDEIWA